MADESSPWPSQKGVLIFKETKITAVIERNEERRRGIEGTYAVEGNRIIITGLFIDTAPEQGALGDGEFALDGDMLTITWLSTNPTCQTPHHVDKCCPWQYPPARPSACWILPRQSPMMQAHVSGIMPLGATDCHFAEARQWHTTHHSRALPTPYR